MSSHPGRVPRLRRGVEAPGRWLSGRRAGLVPEPARYPRPDLAGNGRVHVCRIRGREAPGSELRTLDRGERRLRCRVAARAGDHDARRLRRRRPGRWPGGRLVPGAGGAGRPTQRADRRRHRCGRPDGPPGAAHSVLRRPQHRGRTQDRTRRGPAQKILGTLAVRVYLLLVSVVAARSAGSCPKGLPPWSASSSSASAGCRWRSCGGKGSDWARCRGCCAPPAGRCADRAAVRGQRAAPHSEPPWDVAAYTRNDSHCS